MRRQAYELVADAPGGADHGAGIGHRELVGIVAREVEPRRRGGVEAAGDVHLVGRHAELVGDDLRDDGLVALPARRIADGGPHPAVGLDPHHGRFGRARRRPPSGDDLVGGEVGAGRLDRRRDADAEQSSATAALHLLAPALGIPEPRERGAQRGVVVAAVVLGAGRRAIGHLVDAHVIAKSKLGGIEAEAPRQQRHRALDGEAHERLADAAVGAGRALVGEDRPRLVADGRDPVAVGDVAQLDEVVLGRRDEVLALVGHVAHRQPEQRAIGPVGQRHLHHPAGGVHQRREALAAILEVLHRPAAGHRQQGGGHNVGWPPLVAEAAADVRRDQADLRLGQAQRLGDHADGQAGPLVVAPERVGIGAGVVGGDAAERLERRRRVALHLEALPEHAVGRRERGVHVAVGERVVPDDVAAELRIEQRALAARPRLGVDGGRQHLPRHADGLHRILGRRPIDGRDRDDRLAHEARAVGGQAPVADRHRSRDQRTDRLRERGGLGTGEDRRDAGEGRGRRHVEGDDARVRVGTAQHGHVQEASRREVVQESPATRHQPRGLLQRVRAADPAAGLPRGRHPPARRPRAASATARTIVT